MPRSSLLVVVLVLLGCGDPPAAPRVEREPSRATAVTAPGSAPEVTQPRLAPWGVLFVRSCSVWTATHLVVAADAVTICDGHELDLATGAFRRAREEGWFDADGHVWDDSRAEPDGARRLATRADGAALVSSSRGTRLRVRAGATTAEETVFPFAADQGAFIGDRIVLLSNNDAVWLARGAPARAVEAPPATPAGYEALAPIIERNTDSDDPAWPAFGNDGGSQYTRRISDVAGFQSRAGWVTVSRYDVAELSRARDDDEWASFAMARHLDLGEQRTAKTWRDAAGRRVARGHTYIGGCERAHIDVEVRERAGGAIEVWTATSGQRGALTGALGAMPRDARTVSAVRGDAYVGDPSIGAVR